MNKQKQHLVLYLITATVLITLMVQVYWNYKNYQQNKQRVLNEIQLTLDNAIEIYYSNLSKSNYFTIVEPLHPSSSEKKLSKKTFHNLLNHISKGTKVKAKALKFEYKEDRILPKDISSISIVKGSEKKNSGTITIKTTDKNHPRVQLFRGKQANDSLKFIKGIQLISIAFHNDSIYYNQLDSILKNELLQKKIAVPFYIKHFKKDTLFFTDVKETSLQDFLSINASSTFLKPNEQFKILIKNPTKEALKRSITGIVLSLLLSFAIIASLFYLLYIIQQQKQLSLIKNDLISNITHEFKTPITTISTAIEALNSFDVTNDKTKTKNYLQISKNQLSKLHVMVEKLLETATLDSEQLVLKKETTAVNEILRKLIEKHQLNTQKELQFTSNDADIYLQIDAFHFENAISNLIDNAIKYGGNSIKLHVEKSKKSVKIQIIDDGGGIEKTQQEKIFDKFYRIPKGNTHNVKGFGIGLYYTKKIIEKHGGNIVVSSDKTHTKFTIIFENKS